MTRETKIGLLVGLAFIIVIGILLSDHMTSTNEPIAAPLVNTAGNVRDSVAAPVTDPPPITVVTQDITPRDTVMTHGNSTPARRGESIVQVGPAGSDTPIQIEQTASVPSGRTGNSRPTPGNAATSGNNASLQEVAQANGEQVIGAEPGTGNPPRAAGNSNNDVHKYTAQAGDTLSRLAGRFLGGNNKANRDLIVKANPSLASDPDKIIVGRSYIIPNTASPAAAAPPTEIIAATPAAPTAPVATTPAASDNAQIWYTVKENDSLWSIAADQLGNGSAWTAIKELNADILKGSDSIHPNMKLRLPAKPLASAQ